MARLSMSSNPSTVSNYLTDRFNILSKAKMQQRENNDYFPDIRRTLSSRGYEIDIESSVGESSFFLDDDENSFVQSISIINQMIEGKNKKVKRNIRLEDDLQWLDKGTCLCVYLFDLIVILHCTHPIFFL